MTAILVAGLINLETTLAVEGFPVDYAPVRYQRGGVNTTVSGVGYNIAKALTTLGDPVRFLSLLGDDAPAVLVRQALRDLHIDDQHVLPGLTHTPQSTILYEPSGRRAIFTDLKDIQETPYPLATFHELLPTIDLAVLANINFSRPLLPVAKQAGVLIATDIHAISDLHDAYNTDYMRHADILFQSHEYLPGTPEAWVRSLWDTYGTPLAVVGLGSAGALLAVREHNFMERIPAVYTRPVVNTIGAGDALFSAFIHTYHATKNPYTAIQKAVVFASYKVGANGGAAGFLTAHELDDWHIRVLGQA